MKKIIMMISALFWCFSFVGCNTSNLQKNKKNDSDQSQLFNEINDEKDINDSIPFELINDNELFAFYNESVFINDIDGFYPIWIIEDIGTTTHFAKVHEKYDEDYFKEYSLGIVKFATCSSESGIKLNKVKFENGKIVTIFDINSGYVNDEDLIYSYFVFQIKKEDVSTLANSSYDIDIKVNNMLHPEIGSSHYDKYWEKYKLTVIDNFNLLLNKLEEQYNPGEEIIVRLMFLSGPRVGLKINDEIIESSYEISIQGGELFKFTMPNEDSTLYITWNGFITKPCKEGLHLTVIDSENLLYEKLNDTYKEGEKVTVKVGMLCDAGIAVFLDNKCLGLEKSVKVNNEVHWEFYFTMPDHDATLSLRVYDGFNNYNEYVKEDKYLPSDILLRGIQEEIICKFFI